MLYPIRAAAAPANAFLVCCRRLADDRQCIQGGEWTRARSLTIEP
jgi:hypothetical protein